MFYVALLAIAAKKIGTPRVKGALRVTAYAGGLTLVLCAVEVHKARAAINEKGMQFGEDMMSLAPMLQDVHTVHINGQEVHVSVGSSLDGVSGILDKYEANCQAGLGGDAQVWDHIPDVNDKPPGNMHLKVTPILRQSEKGKGMVVCFLPNDPLAPHSERSLQAALKDFNDSGDISSIGRFRYAYVQEGPKGSSVFTVWTDAGFNLDKMIPQPGKDVDGTDPTVMLRPGDGSRMFTASADGLPYHVYGYSTHQSPLDAIKAYDAKMEAAGWLTVKNPIYEGMEGHQGEGHSYISKEKGFAGVVTATKSDEGDTIVGVAEVTDGKITPPTGSPREADGF